jgi:hypothetical protein
MRIVFVFTLLLTVVVPASAQNKRVGTFRFVAKHGSRTATLVVKTKVFDRSSHKVAIVKEGDSHVTKIDGRTALGTDASIPYLEIEHMKLYFGGKEIPVSRKMYADCFDPHVESDGLLLKFGEDPESLFVFMQGSDGAGVYDVIWVLRKDGRHTRLANAAGDCGFLNFECPLTKSQIPNLPKHNKGLPRTGISVPLVDSLRVMQLSSGR